MAVKGKIESGERSNRVRFVMLEAELSDTNVNALATAIVSALRPDAPAPKRLPPLAPTAATRISAAVGGSNGHDAPEEPVQPEVTTEEEQPESVEQASTASAPARVRKASKPTQPKYIAELFATAAEADPFKAFVAQHPTKKESERYLVASLYLRNHGHPVVNLDKIYTCYRTAEWSMTINDWDVNLRNQVRNDRFRRVDGGYSITTQGEATVQALRKK